MLGDKLISGAWANDGIIFVKDKASKTHRMQAMADIKQFKSSISSL